MNKLLLWLCRMVGFLLIIIPCLQFIVYFHVFSLFFISLLGLFVFFLPEINRLVKRILPKKYRLIKNIFTIIAILCILWFITVILIMVKGANTPAPPKGTPVVILGCGLAGTHVDAMLECRANKAIDYLLHKDTTAKCIVSGGKGADEIISEAQSIKNYLMEHGIPESRILLEDQSTNTFENIRNSANIAKQEGSTGLAVATDAYHEFRVSLLVKKQNMADYAIPSETPSALFLAYWIRESVAVTKVLILGS